MRNIKDSLNEKLSQSSRSDCMIIDDVKPKSKLVIHKKNKILPKIEIDERKESMPDFIKDLQERSEKKSPKDEPEKTKDRYKIINELSKSDYFGEISLMTKLPVTATIRAVSSTVL